MDGKRNIKPKKVQDERGTNVRFRRSARINVTVQTRPTCTVFWKNNQASCGARWEDYISQFEGLANRKELSHPLDLLVTGIFPTPLLGRSKTGWFEFLLLYFPWPLVGGWLKRQTQRKKGIKTKDGYFTDGITNWRPKGTEDAEPWRKQEVGVAGTDRQMPMAAQGRTRGRGSGSAHGRTLGWSIPPSAEWAAKHSGILPKPGWPEPQDTWSSPQCPLHGSPLWE